MTTHQKWIKDTVPLVTHHSEQPNETRRPIGRRVPYTSRRFEFTTVWETWRGDSAGWRKVDKVSGKVTTPGWTFCKACTWDKSQRRDEIESAEKRHLSLAVKDRPLIRNPQTVHFTITTRLSLPPVIHLHAFGSVRRLLYLWWLANSRSTVLCK